MFSHIYEFENEKISNYLIGVNVRNMKILGYNKILYNCIDMVDIHQDLHINDIKTML